MPLVTAPFRRSRSAAMSCIAPAMSKAMLPYLSAGFSVTVGTTTLATMRHLLASGRSGVCDDDATSAVLPLSL
eukprot:scaffold76727_cov49-Phaeocystis_antarctica.AAC.2